MGNLIIEEFKKSLNTGFVDKDTNSDILYQPELLVNQKRPKKKVLSTIIQELSNCEEFYISVAFVTTSGVATLMNTFDELQKRGIKGKLLVSQYLNFTQPEALKRLLCFENIDLRIATNSNSHSKGYIFKTPTYYNLIVGSSNLTASALATNKEWNLKVSALLTSGIVDKVLSEFKSDFENGIEVTEKFIAEYSEVYNRQKIVSSVEIKLTKSPIIEPNLMQKEALKNLDKLRSNNKTKALLISATGTGKTYLSAFDAKLFNAKRLLFVVHRLNITQKAMKTFQSIFGNQRTMGLYSGNKRELNKDFIFSTIQTISKQEHLNQFSIDYFDYIVIDESHRSGAESYQRLVSYFEPKFLLGMTATPERTDGNDIFSVFDHNIAYEIRLNRAMEEDMLSEFHYYGVTDVSVNDEILENLSDFNLLTADERIDKIIRAAKFYGTDNGINRGLAFCSRKEEAKMLSDKFNDRGYKSVSLTGDDSEEDRIDAINRLESDSITEKLDYIFTVDIFNEGVDIPKVNQILMIRPTESAIIFVQQLGRGLRKASSKAYLTVIDFIGNYKNNYLIPIAIYGDKSYNKDALRRMVSDGSREIPGASTINFDKVTKERIFKSIDSANLRLMKDLKKDYNILKFKLGRTPLMVDFIKHGERDPFSYVEHSRSFLNFIVKVDRDFESKISHDSQKLLEVFSKEINNAKRVEECIILKALIEVGRISILDLKNRIKEDYGYQVSDLTINSCLINLNLSFIRDKKNKKLLPVGEILGVKVVNLDNAIFELNDQFKIVLLQEQFKVFLLDSIDYSIEMFNQKFDMKAWNKGFILYQKYSRKDVFRILNIAENPVAQNVGGYMVTQDKKHCPIFVNYHKEDDISESTKYEDEFLNNREFIMFSKSGRTFKSPDVQSILGNNGKIRLPFFIKKNNDEGQDFYYMGDVNPDSEKAVPTEMLNDKGKKISAIKIHFNLEVPVSNSLYNYLTDINLVNNQQKDEISVSTKEEKEIIKSDKVLEKKNLIPFYDFYAAAGAFSEMQSEKNFKMIEVPERYSSTIEYFACTVKGESMNKVIPDNSICLFKKYSGGSRHGKIVLVENIDYQDPDFNSAFTVKTYTSEKIITEEGWEHVSIVLRPNSYDNFYKNIIIDEVSGSEMRIVGEFVMVL
jgi:superfamily II DNA or RNA helicase/phage repressor protein C with HTH and peptisase S24 domain